MKCEKVKKLPKMAKNILDFLLCPKL